jgi:hypothetical protein
VKALVLLVLLAGPAYAQEAAWTACQKHFTLSLGAGKGNPARVHYDSPERAAACAAVEAQMHARAEERRRSVYRDAHP